jgi:hypothetical protein
MDRVRADMERWAEGKMDKDIRAAIRWLRVVLGRKQHNRSIERGLKDGTLTRVTCDHRGCENEFYRNNKHTDISSRFYRYCLEHAGQELSA